MAASWTGTTMRGYREEAGDYLMMIDGVCVPRGLFECLRHEVLTAVADVCALRVSAEWRCTLRQQQDPNFPFRVLLITLGAL